MCQYYYKHKTSQCLILGTIFVGECQLLFTLLATRSWQRDPADPASLTTLEHANTYTHTDKDSKHSGCMVCFWKLKVFLKISQTFKCLALHLYRHNTESQSCPFLNFNGYTVEVCEWISNFSPNCFTCFCWRPSQDRPDKGYRYTHRWPSTQPSRIAHNLATHHRAAHNPVARWCAASVVCVTRMGYPNGPEAEGPNSFHWKKWSCCTRCC